jgi:hypothetical protein
MTVRVFLSICILVFSAGCGVPAIQQRPLVHGAQRAFDRPGLVVAHDGLALDLAVSIELRVPVVLTSARQSVLEERRIGRGAQASGFLMEFRSVGEEGAAPQGTYTVVLHVDSIHQPRGLRSAALELLFVSIPREGGLPPSQLLRLASPDGQILYLLAIDMQDPSLYLPLGLNVSPTADPLFRTTWAGLEGCPVDRTHYFVQVDTAARSGRMTPGQDSTFMARGDWFRVAVLDHSAASVPPGCPVAAEGHTSYVVWGVPAPN